MLFLRKNRGFYLSKINIKLLKKTIIIDYKQVFLIFICKIFFIYFYFKDFKKGKNEGSQNIKNKKAAQISLFEQLNNLKFKYSKSLENDFLRNPFSIGQLGHNNQKLIA